MIYMVVGRDEDWAGGEISLSIDLLLPVYSWATVQRYENQNTAVDYTETLVLKKDKV